MNEKGRKKAKRQDNPKYCRIEYQNKVMYIYYFAPEYTDVAQYAGMKKLVLHLIFIKIQSLIIWTLVVVVF